jgi:hypothetical protein
MTNKKDNKDNKKDANCNTQTNKVDINSLEWNEYVLNLLSDDEKIDGNPTTDGLRRIFEIALECVIIDSSSQVIQSPEPSNEKRATVVHSISYVLNNKDIDQEIKTRSVNGAADVYWGNCDKIYRNHPVAVAETRAEGRALRRGLRLRKVVAAEELANNIEDDIDNNSVGKISDNQINFIDTLAKRLDINITKMLVALSLDPTKINNISHENAVLIIRNLSGYQQSMSNIPDDIKGYEPSWR